MKSIRRLLLLAAAVPFIHSTLITAAHACKPCPGDPVTQSARRARAIALGRVEATGVTSTSDRKRGPGRARMELQLERWLASGQESDAPKTGQTFEIELAWDGVCSQKPQLPPAGARVIVFLLHLPQEGPVTPTGYCTTPVLEVAENRVQIPGDSADTWGGKTPSLTSFEETLKEQRRHPKH